MFLDQVIEIDLYTHLRRVRFIEASESYQTMEDLFVLIPQLGRSVVLPLRPSIQGYGTRMAFQCQYCNRKVQKLYLHPGHYDYTNKHYPIACRNCHKLKYVSQYRKGDFHKREVAEYKLKRLEGQKRRYWYGDNRTQFGKRWQKLKNDSMTFWDIVEAMYRIDPDRVLADFKRIHDRRVAS